MKQVNDKSIEDTGERMIPAYHKGKLVYGEHIVRYQALKGIVRGKTVLDIASGSGYGTSLISESAQKVYGVDVDQDAISYAKKNYGSSKTEFMLGDGKEIPLPSNSVNVVVSFETIEHIEDYRHFLSEVKRVLVDDGLFVLSTPNDEEFPEGAHFHIHEFKREELEELVKGYFKYTKNYFQATWLYNALVEESQLESEWEASVQTLNTAPVNATKAIYFYMLLSNREIEESVDTVAAISEHWSDRKVLEHNVEIDKYIRDTIQHYENILSAKDIQISELQSETKRLHKKYGENEKSFTRRVIKKVKSIQRKIKQK